ncbi:MAG: ABC transporter permease, partial [Gemmatimonadaceae bacterium]
FSVVDAVLLRPLDYKDADRLVGLWSTHPNYGPFNLPSYPDFADWRSASKTLSGLAFTRGDGFLLRGPDGAERLAGARVSEGFLGVIGARAVVGRTFTADEERPGGPRVVVLGNALWRRRFGGDPKVVGTTVRLDDQAYTVVGVLTRGATYPEWAELYTPMAPWASDPALRERALRVDNRAVARLAPGATIEQARAELATIAQRLADEYPETNAKWSVAVNPLRDDIVQGAGRGLYVLLGAVGLVLLVACANVANLVLARAVGRGREVAVRTALGAGRGRVARQLVTEGLVLGLLGGAAGALVASWSVRAFVAVATAQPWNSRVLPRLEEVAVDGRVLALATAATLVTSLLFSLAPVLHASRLDLVTALREGGRGASGGRAAGRMRAALVAGEVALAMLLLVGAGLLLESQRRLAQVDLGYDPSRVVVAPLFIPSGKYASPEQAVALYRRLRDEAAALPGARVAAVANHAPFVGSTDTRIEIPGRAQAAGDPELRADFRTASAEYFDAMGISVSRGRGLTAADMTPNPGAVVVSEAFARAYWPGEDALGRALVVHKAVPGRPDFREPMTVHVVGVAKDTRHWSVEVPPRPQLWLPYTVNPPNWVTLVVSARGDPAPLVPLVRHMVTAIDPDIPVADVKLLADRVALATASRRLYASVLGAFSALALVLAAVGVYGVLAYAVAQRTREIGVRVALGARPREVVRLVVRQGMTVVAVGLAAGLAGALVLGKALQGIVFGVSVRDPLVLGAGAATLAAAALAATLLPARRAARVDPMEALRAE